MTRGLAYGSAALTLAVAGCFGRAAPRPAPDPFKAPRAQVGAEVQIIALAPMTAPRDLPNAEHVKGRFLSTLDARLTEAGFRVLPASDVGPIVELAMEWRRGVGFYDPATGKLNVEKVKEAREEALDRLRQMYGRVDAILFPELRVVQVRFESDLATWDGTTQNVAETSLKKVFFLDRHSGLLRALSLVVWLTGKDGGVIYTAAGGVELVEKVDLWGKRVQVPVDKLLLDEARNASAVHLATAALVQAASEARARGGAAIPAGGAPAATPPANVDPTPAPPSAPPRRESSDRAGGAGA